MSTVMDRRAALQGLVVAAASVAVPAAWAGPTTAEAALPAATPPRLLLDARLTSAEWQGLVVPGQAAEALALQGELVRQWRRELWATLRSTGGPVRALVRWDHALVLQGLAREERCQATVRQCGPALFEVRFNA